MQRGVHKFIPMVVNTRFNICLFRNFSRRPKVPKKKSQDDTAKDIAAITADFTTNKFMTVKELAGHVNKRTTAILQTLQVLYGEEKTADSYVSLKVAERLVLEMVRGTAPTPDFLKPRPPIVTVMGHVDHGKTTLLDRLRGTSVASGEPGGITQHIGAFSVPMATGRSITFLDTPGHAAFSALRSRGAQVTDIVVLLVAANDGVMPQTIESIEMAKEANVPVIVAINKCDKFSSNIAKIKEELMSHGIQLEEFGGDVQSVNISALTGSGLDLLEEAIIVEADLRELRADPIKPVEGVVLETRTTKGFGSVATVLVSRGTMKKGCVLVSGNVSAQIRVMYNEKGMSVHEATPSTPVLTAGWQNLPQAGEECFEVESKSQANKVIQYRQIIAGKYRELGEREKLIAKMNEANKESRVDDSPLVISVVIKTDVAGSLEALEQLLESSQPTQIKVQVIDTGIGNITETDIDTAQACKGVILAFNVSTNKTMKKYASDQGVTVLSHNVIYKLMDQLKEWLQDQLPTITQEDIIGEAVVNNVFQLTGSKRASVGGCRVKKGKLVKDGIYQLWRGEELIHEGNLIGMKRLKDDITSALKETECGLSFKVDPGWKVGDRVVCIHRKQVPQVLKWDLGF